MGIGLAFSTLRRTLRHGWDGLITLALSGLIWYVGAILIIPLGTVTAGLHRVAQPLSEERASNWHTMLEHLRDDLRWSTLLIWSLVAGFLFLSYNLVFYSNSGSQYLRYLAVTIFVFVLIWLAVMLVAFPMALRQEDRALRQTLRNSIVLVFSSLPSMLVSLLLLGITTALLLALPPLFVLIPGWVALWGEEQTRLLLVRAGYLTPDEFADRPRAGRG
ncbi:MAG: hypothetical protein H0X37_24440 [Herpetosiphonaceae bacterium]|nr:hypothetical protein [Herpetosiphonaceae bacterium]